MFPCPALSSETKAARASSAIDAGPQITTASDPLRPLAASRIEAGTSGRLRVIALLESPFNSSAAPVTYLRWINKTQGTIVTGALTRRRRDDRFQRQTSALSP